MRAVIVAAVMGCKGCLWICLATPCEPDPITWPQPVPDAGDASNTDVVDGPSQ
jgi:hypothetical protein